MLNHLFATFLICMGVANTTPISNYDQKETNLVLTTPKKENIISDYELNITISNATSSTTQILGTGNSLYPNGYQENNKGNFQNNNSYINVIGTTYRTKNYAIITDENNQNVEGVFVDNVNKVNETGFRTCRSFLMKLTPYNYNIDTETNIKLRFSLEELTDINDEDFFAYEIYYKRYIYKINDSAMDQYINLQSYQDATSTIQYEITNINNGFFYTSEEELIQIGYNNYNSVINDEFEIGLTPKIDNYYFIIYRPCARFVYNTNEQTQPMKMTYGMNINEIKIRGTNIIPDGTYEVVDIPGLMFEVIGMPFAFVSQAFNLTLFPGTPYQVNIANLFLSIAAIFVFVWLLLLFIKMKG